MDALGFANRVSPISLREDACCVVISADYLVRMADIAVQFMMIAIQQMNQ